MRTDATTFAILGMLTLSPMSGYDLKKAYAQGPAHFWTLNYGQIYPLLQRLQRAGKIVGTKTKDARRRRQYSITARGRAELESWLETAPGQPAFRNEFLMKLFFAPTNKKLALQHLRAYAEAQKETLRGFDEVERWLRERFPSDARLEIWLITLDYGRAQSRALLDWVLRSTLQLEKPAK